MRPLRSFHFTSCAQRITAAALTLVTIGSATLGAQSAVASPSAQQAQPARPQGPATLGGFELTAAQRVKIDSISAKHAAEMKTVGEMLLTDPAEAMKRMVLLRTTMQKEVRVVLTPDQRAIFDRNVAEMNAQMNAYLSPAPR